jgi:hypothetical protein
MLVKNYGWISQRTPTAQSSGPGKFRPQGLTDPDVTVSAHPALMIQQLKVV